MIFDRILTVMKKVNVIGLIILFVLAASPAAMSMGGEPPATSKPEVSTPAASESQQPTRAEDVAKARAEVENLQAELNKVEKYIWQLDTKIIQVRKTGNAKRLLELKQLEQETLERARFLEGGIARKKEAYPELKEVVQPPAPKAEAPIQTIVEEQPLTAQNAGVDIIQPPASEMPTVIEQPASLPPAPAKPKVSRTIVYHTVGMGDTLMSISRRYFGTPSLYKDIAKMNNITDVNGLRQGMRLKIDLSLKKKVNPYEGL